MWELMVPPAIGEAILHFLPAKCLFNPLTLTRSPSPSSISPHWHRLYMPNNIAQIFKSTLEFPSVDSLGGFAGVFEGDTEVSAASAGRFAGLYFCGCVANLDGRRVRG